MLYQWDSSRDYNPSPGLEKVKATVLAINAADDERNPPELGLLDREIKRVQERPRAAHPGKREHGGTRHHRQREVLPARARRASAVGAAARFAVTRQASRSLGERAIDLHLDGAFGQAFLFAPLPEGREVRGIAVSFERCVVRVGLVEEEELRVLGGAMRAVDEATGLGLQDDGGLLGQQSRQRIALALGCAQPRDDREVR